MLQDVVPKYPKDCAVEWVDAEDTLFLLYTSGSTGKPKVCSNWTFETASPDEKG
jgi:acetyl-CoA synthetase